MSSCAPFVSDSFQTRFRSPSSAGKLIRQLGNTMGNESRCVQLFTSYANLRRSRTPLALLDQPLLICYWHLLAIHQTTPEFTISDYKWYTMVYEPQAWKCLSIVGGTNQLLSNHDDAPSNAILYIRCVFHYTARSLRGKPYGWMAPSSDLWTPRGYCQGLP